MSLVLMLALFVGDPLVRLSAEPLRAEVGEPIRATLELIVDDVLDEPFDATAAFDESWAVLDLRRDPPRRAGTDGRAMTRWTWTVVSLEPGERSLADALVVPLGVETALAGEAPVLSITSVLTAEDEGPRPLVGWSSDLSLDGTTGSGWILAWIAGAAAVVLVLLAVLVRSRSRRRRTPEDANESLAERAAALELERLPARPTEELRAGVFALTALVREAADARRGTALPGATDDEWLAHVRAESRLDERSREGLGSIFERTTQIKYAGARPSDLALELLARDARVLLEGLLGTDAERAA